LLLIFIVYLAYVIYLHNFTTKIKVTLRPVIKITLIEYE